jgi:hypothetical protein
MNESTFMRKSLAASALIVAALLSNACERANPAAPNGSAALTSTASLMLALQHQGASVAAGAMLPHALPCFAVDGQVLIVNGESINAFEYRDAAAAETDAAKISPDGSKLAGAGCAAAVDWVGPPHFYKRDRVISVYVGSNAAVIQLLEVVLGKAFAPR